MQSKIKTGGCALVKTSGHYAHKQRLAARGWTTRAAAHELGRGKSHVSAVLNGHRGSKSLLARLWALPDRDSKGGRES